MPEAIGPTHAALFPYLIPNTKTIRNQYDRREAHSYGPEPRQELDVYYPHEYDDRTPALLFLFGGGFFRGDKRNPEHPDLVYANLGGFFSGGVCNKGFITVVANYRLSKGPGGIGGNAIYPSGGEDTALALDWITETFGKKRRVFVMGHSSGGTHVLTYLLEPSIRNSIDVNLAGVILLSPPCHQRGADPRRITINIDYYGDETAVEKYSPIGLLLEYGPVSTPLLTMIAKFEEPGIIQSWGDFKLEYQKLGGKCDEIINIGHNHISAMVSLNSVEPAGSKWGNDVIEWMLRQS